MKMNNFIDMSSKSNKPIMHRCSNTYAINFGYEKKSDASNYTTYIYVYT